ncbi:hypothetical protein ACHWQZ_G018698 [Mnemiopsis leidyi]
MEFLKLLISLAILHLSSSRATDDLEQTIGWGEELSEDQSFGFNAVETMKEADESLVMEMEKSQSFSISEAEKNALN